MVTRYVMVWAPVSRFYTVATLFYAACPPAWQTGAFSSARAMAMEGALKMFLDYTDTHRAQEAGSCSTLPLEIGRFQSRRQPYPSVMPATGTPAPRPRKEETRGCL